MKLSRLIALASVTCAVVACGGTGSSPAASPEFQAAAPSYERFAVTQSDADTAEPAEADVVTLQNDAQASSGPDCHPHLFQRSHEIISRVNRHFAKVLRHVEDAVKDNPSLKTNSSHVWDSVKNGVERKLTITAATNADASITYTYTLEMKTAAQTAFATVFSGNLTSSGTAAVDGGAAASGEEKGSITFDFTALSTVLTNEKSRGQITDAFDHVKDATKGVKRTANLTLTAFLPEEGDAHGLRTGSYVWEREPGVGGSFAFQDTLVLLCTSNPNALTSDLIAVARWYKATDASVHARTDAQATGGQLPTGNVWVGATCAQGASTATPAEGYWMVKEENASGATVVGKADTSGLTPCDAMLGGAAPDVGSNVHDFAFTGISFTTPYPFPNEW